MHLRLMTMTTMTKVICNSQSRLSRLYLRGLVEHGFASNDLSVEAD